MECQTATSRRSLLDIVDGSRRPPPADLQCRAPPGLGPTRTSAEAATIAALDSITCQTRVQRICGT
jgi:hypothetical protein